MRCLFGHFQEQNDHVVYRMPDVDLFPPRCPGRTSISVSAILSILRKLDVVFAVFLSSEKHSSRLRSLVSTPDVEMIIHAFVLVRLSQLCSHLPQSHVTGPSTNGPKCCHKAVDQEQSTSLPFYPLYVGFRVQFKGSRIQLIRLQDKQIISCIYVVT